MKRRSGADVSELVRLKPLEWVCINPAGYEWVAKTIFGELRVRAQVREGEIVAWYSAIGAGEADSLDAAKSAAEAYYRERIAAAFESPWQPIATAPRDETEILVCHGSAPRTGDGIWRWDANLEEWVDRESWFYRSGDGCLWMPIPPLPEGETT